MQFDVFISYAWGGPENTAHREWVRLLAAHLKQIGFHVGIDSVPSRILRTFPTAS